jgi:aryl-alcohol dehydrogenase-like predicted oxidoreductase
MEMRDFGRSGTRVSLLGFGCGAVGGLMVRGDPADQERTIARALEAGVNYFDTAVQYGDGASERNLGRVLKNLNPADAVVGTKVRLQATDANRIENAIRQSLEGSLERLGRDRVDVFYLHNPITLAGGGDALSQRQVIEEVAPAFDRLRREGKIRIAGFTAIGDTDALGAVTDSGMFGAAQPAARCPAPRSATRSPARLRSRSVRRSPMRRTSRVPED